MIVYKIVRVDGDRRLSFSSDLHLKAVVSYQDGQWSEPVLSGSMLYAFGKLERAIDFLRKEYKTSERYEIWRCETQDATRFTWACLYFNRIAELRKWWKSMLNGTPLAILEGCVGPNGTVWCSKLKLDRCVFIKEPGENWIGLARRVRKCQK